MSGIVVFNYAIWIARYPEFSTVPNIAEVAPICFAEAGVYCNNTPSSPVCDVALRAMFLNMLTAHIVAINFGVGGQPASQLVGRINSAGEGSVHVASDMGKVSEYAAWFLQTKYGAAYWQASAQYRTMLYVAPPRGAFDFIPRMG